ncbi:hypothetical protein [Geotalea sp. SG265]|uniref:hypothetical protein n=1 Tax=Geotalea sp. SG265 TaxID=2922867 RepID=UPI001FAF3D87|nr:hypothetical protein [Geotalea sp. SG265]
MKFFKVMFLVLMAGLIAACGGGGNSPGSNNANVNLSSTTNVGGGYTLTASGGTLNDGSTAKGLALLVTLRDSNGNGPGLNGGWQISLTGPGITRPLMAKYDDGAPSSYQIWRWQDITPSSGTYTATASNGAVTISSTFNLSTSSTIPRAAISKTGSTISWNPVSGAGSYYYKLTDGTGSTVSSGFIDGATASPSLQLPGLTDGSYLVEVLAYSQNFTTLMSDTAAAPSLAAPNNCSVASLDMVLAGGAAGSYNLAAKGGILYLGKDAKGVDQYGLTVWTSLLTSTDTTPAGDWTITVTGPGIATPLSFTYPRTNSHYLYWDFGTTPLSGTYTVTAAASGYSLTSNFTIPDLSAQLPVVTNIAVIPTSSNYGVSWGGVPGAASYYVSIWTMINGVYTEVQGLWVGGSAFAASLARSSLTKGTTYDVYVTAASVDMTTSGSVPPPSPVQVNMSDNTYRAVSFTAQ